MSLKEKWYSLVERYDDLNMDMRTIEYELDDPSGDLTEDEIRDLHTRVRNLESDFEEILPLIEEGNDEDMSESYRYYMENIEEWYDMLNEVY